MTQSQLTIVFLQMYHPGIQWYSYLDWSYIGTVGKVQTWRLMQKKLQGFASSLWAPCCTFHNKKKQKRKKMEK